MKFHRSAASFICALLAAIMLLSSSGLTLLASARVTEADKKKIESQISKNEDNLASIKETLEALRAESAAAIEIKEQLDAEASALQDNIDLTEELIETYKQSIKDTIVEISQKQRQADAKYEQIMVHLRASYESGNQNYLEIIFSSSSLTELLTRTERLHSLLNYQEKQIKELEEEKAYLAALRESLESDLAQTEVLEASLQADKDQLAVSIAEAEAIIKGLEEDTKDAQDLKNEYEKAEAELDKKLNAIIKELKEQAAAGIAQGSYIWPVPKKYTRISSYFGWRTDPLSGERKYHNGMDIPCDKGQPIYASNNGVVVAAEYNKSYGYYIMLSHGDGIQTLYAHNSKLCVSVGQVVKKGQVIAKAGSTGRSTGSHCHFEVRIDGTRVSPLDTKNRGNAYVTVPKK